MATKSASNTPDFLKDPDAVLNDTGIKWLQGSSPDYSKVNQLYNKEKVNTFKSGSFAELISNLIKNWEKEASHKLEYSQWRTVDQTNFQISVNGSPFVPGDAVIPVGTYNALIGDTEFYASSKVSCEESHAIFRHTLGKGFAWEVVDMYSNGFNEGPVVFKWRHWGEMSGQLKCPVAKVQGTSKEDDYLIVEPSFKTVEIFGICVLKICPTSFRLLQMEIFFNPVDIFKRMIESSKGQGQ